MSWTFIQLSRQNEHVTPNGSYLWHKGFDLGVIAKILGHKDISMLVEVYGHTLEEKIFEEFNQIRDIWKDCS